MVAQTRRRLFLIGLGLVLLFAVVWSLIPPKPKDHSTVKVGVFLFARHPIITDIHEGFTEEMDRDAAKRQRKIEYVVKSADGDMVQASQVASFFKTSDVDVVFAVGLPAAQSLQTAQVTKPIVLGGPPDPVSAGLVTSLKGHNSNITGTRYLPRVGVMLSVLGGVLPGAKSVAVFHNPAEANSMAVVKLLDLEAKAAGIEVRHFPVANAQELDAALRALPTANVQAVFLPTDNLIHSNLDRILAQTTQVSIPVFDCTRESVQKGALFSLATDYRRIGNLSATIAAQIVFDGVPPNKIDILDVSEGKLYIRSDHALSARFTDIPNYPIERIP